MKEAQSDEVINAYREAADKSDWCGYMTLMETREVKLAKSYNDQLGRYEEPLGFQIFGIELNNISYVTRLHEWTIEYHPKDKTNENLIDKENYVVKTFTADSIPDVSSFFYQPERASRVLEFCQ